MGRRSQGPGDPGLTDTGREQAFRTAWWLQDFGLNAVYSSPQRRAWETAEIIAAAWPRRPAEGRAAARAHELGRQPAVRATSWPSGTRSTLDRDYVPSCGDSSRRAGERLRAFLLDVTAEPGPVAAATHGGVTLDLLRTLLGDGACRAGCSTKGSRPARSPRSTTWMSSRSPRWSTSPSDDRATAGQGEAGRRNRPLTLPSRLKLIRPVRSPASKCSGTSTTVSSPTG